MSLPNIYAFNKTSEAGSNVFTPSIFVQGCNLQCPFCFNSLLAKSKMKKTDIIPIEIVDDFIKKNNCDMIIISGGEPLTIKNIDKLIIHFKDLGIKVGLSTHGIFTDRLKNVIPLLSYVAMDIKSSDRKVYQFLNLSNDENTIDHVFESKEVLFQEKLNRKDFSYEIRTSLYPAYVSLKTIKEIGVSLHKDEKWVLQQYRPTKNLYDMEETKNVVPYNFEELQEIVELASSMVDEVVLRYV